MFFKCSLLALVEYDYESDSVLQEDFAVSRQWQSGVARVHDVRQAGSRVHQQARTCNALIMRAARQIATRKQVANPE